MSNGKDRPIAQMYFVFLVNKDKTAAALFLNCFFLFLAFISENSESNQECLCKVAFPHSESITQTCVCEFTFTHPEEKFSKYMFTKKKMSKEILPPSIYTRILQR